MVTGDETRQLTTDVLEIEEEPKNASTRYMMNEETRQIEVKLLERNKDEEEVEITPKGNIRNHTFLSIK